MKKLMFVFLLVIVQGCSKSEDKIKNYLASGKSLYQQGIYDKAKIEFKNVIQLDAKQSDAYYHLALIDEKNQNWQGMFANLTQVTRLDPKNNDAFLKLGRLTLLSGRAEDTLKHADAVLKNAPDNPDGLALKGAVFVKQGNLDGAMTLADQILKKYPDHTDAISLKTVIYLSKKDMSAALETVEKALQTKPTELSLELLKLQVHSQSKNLAAVEQDYLNLIKQFPDKLEYTYALVKHYADNGQEDKALTTLQEVIDSHPDKMQPKLVLIDFQMQKTPEIAEKSLTTYLAQYPGESDLHFRLAALYIKQNKLTEAKQALNKIVELKPTAKEGLSAKIMLAKLALQENDSSSADSFIKEVLTTDGRNLEALLLKARLDLQKGLYDEVISNLRTVLRDYSNSDEGMVLMGQAYLKKNSPELAEENFRKALAVNPANFDALMPVVSNMLKNKDLSRADELLQKALAVKPDNPGALQALAQIRLMQKDWSGTQKIADTIASKPKGAGFSKFLSAKISEDQGLYKEAISQYKEALAISPELSDALRGMVNSYAALKQGNVMLAYLDEFMKAHPDDSYSWLLKGQLLANEKHFDDALKVLSDAVVKWPKTPEFYEAIAAIHVQKKETDKAIAILIKGLEAMPEEVRLSVMLASTYEQMGDYAKALETYDALIAKHPTVDIATNNLVSLLLDHFNTKENIERAVSLAKHFEKSDQPYFVDSYAWALINSGKNEEALQLLRNVVKKLPEVPVFRYHLGLAYHKTNSKALAVTELEEALKLGDKTGGFIEKEAVEKLLKTIKTASPT
ncbi:tetratricopeptide repeat protein [Methyloglobulus sp.]|uniref:tetratricopeptide repeat protein n=1 Tax=Methyloglobulus sp. TaxID=2518622 RepID=UPI0032B77997